MDKQLKRLFFPFFPKRLKKILISINAGKITGRIARGTTWVLTGNIISKIFTLILSICIARLLGKVHYGELGMVQSTVNMFVTFAGFGLGVTSTKYVSELRETNPLKVGQIIASSNAIACCLGAVSTIAFFLLSDIISVRSINAPYLVNEIRLSSFMLFFAAINGAQVGALSGFEDFKSIAKITIYSVVLFVPIQCITTYFWGLDGAILGLSLNYFLQYLLNFYALRKTALKFNVRIRLKNSFNDISYIWKFSLPALLSVLVLMIISWYVNTMLVTQKNGFGEMAIINASFQWTAIVLFIPMAISAISLPIFSNSQNNLITLIKLVKVNVIFSMTFGLTVAIILSLFSKQIMNAYGPGFQGGSKVLIILLFAAVLNSLNSIIGQVIASFNKMWIGFILNFIYAFSFLGFAYYYFNKGMGSMGYCQSYLFAYIIHTITVTAFSLYYLKKKQRNIFDHAIGMD